MKKLIKNNPIKALIFSLVFLLAIIWFFADRQAIFDFWFQPTPATPQFQTDQLTFRLDEQPTFEIQLPVKKLAWLAEWPRKLAFWPKKAQAQAVMAGGAWQFDNQIIRVDIKNSARNKSIDENPEIKLIGNNKIRIALAGQAEKNIRPGKYNIQVEIKQNDQTYNLQQDFFWGVLAINADKSTYLLKEQAYLQMAVLNEYGHTICEANLKLEIQDPQGGITILTTKDGAIIRSDTCGPNNVTDQPDYFAYYPTNQIGRYQLKLTNLDNHYEITDSFEARGNIPFEVERVGATRINPFQANYVMSIKVKANQDFAGQIIEQVPENFQITRQAGMKLETRGGLTKISWNLKIKAGEETTLHYKYKAPEISPQIFLLGPVRFEQNNSVLFEEARQWQLASDYSCVASADGSWTTAGTWGATCGGGYPGQSSASDTVTINSGVNVTLNVSPAYAVASIAFAAAATAAGDITFDASSRQLTVSGAITFGAPGNKGTTLLAVGNGTLTAGSIAINSGTNAARSSTLSVSTGTITANGAISFSGTAAGAILTSTGAATFNLNNSVIGNGGALTIAQGTNITSTGTSGIAYATAVTTWGALTVSFGTFTLSGANETFTGVNISNGAVLAADTFLITDTGNYANSGEHSGSGGVTVSGASSAISGTDGNISNTGAFTISGATASISAGSTLTFAGTITPTATTNNGAVAITAATSMNGTAWTNAASSTLNVAGAVTVTTLTATASGNTVNYNSTAGAQTVKDITYANLTITKSGQTATLAGATTVNETLLISAGTLDVGDGLNYDLILNGDYTNNGAFTARAGEVALSGSGTQTLSGTMTGASAFYDLTITNSSGSYAGSCAASITPGVDFAAAATIANNYTITTAGVKVRYLTNTTYTFANINWHDQDSTDIVFRNSADSSDWNLTVTGTQTAVHGVDVSRSDAALTSGGINAYDGSNTDCLNNINWTFTQPTSITSPNSVAMPDYTLGGPGYNDRNFSDVSALIQATATSGFTVQISSTALTGTNTIPASDVKLKTDGTVGTNPTIIQNCSDFSGVAETASGEYGLDTAKTIVTTTSGTGTCDIYPTIRIYVSNEYQGGQDTGVLTFTIF